MSEPRPNRVKVRKVELLEFIYLKKAVSAGMLEERFNLANYQARRRLSQLGKQKLVINLQDNFWVLTDEGIRRLAYYGKI